MARGMGRIQRTIKALVSKQFAAQQRLVHPAGWHDSHLLWGLLATALAFILWACGVFVPIVSIARVFLAVGWVFLVFSFAVLLRDLRMLFRVVITTSITLAVGMGLIQVARHPDPLSEILAVVRDVQAKVNALGKQHEEARIVLHIEPEHGVLNSITSKGGIGEFTLELHNTGMEDVDGLRITQEYRSIDIPTHRVVARIAVENPFPHLKAKASLPIHVTLRDAAKPLSSMKAALIVVKITAFFRRQGDGSDDSIVALYGSEGKNAELLYGQGSALDYTSPNGDRVALEEIPAFLQARPSISSDVARLAFLVFPLNPTRTPVKTISTRLVDGVAEVNFTARVIGPVAAGKGSLWLKLGDGCGYASEPAMQCPTCGPFLRDNDDLLTREHAFSFVYRGVVLPRTTVRIIPPSGAKEFVIGFWYTCDNCAPLETDHPQTLTVKIE